MATPDDFVERLAEQIGGSTRASAAFGKPVERGGITVIPVAKARWGFGGGGGGDGEQHGSGGGGAGSITPIGYIEVRKSGAQFKPIRGPRLAFLAGGAAAGLVGLAVYALRRG